MGKFVRRNSTGTVGVNNGATQQVRGAFKSQTQKTGPNGSAPGLPASRSKAAIVGQQKSRPTTK